MKTLKLLLFPLFPLFLVLLTATGAEAQKASRPNANLLTQEEITKAAAANVYDLVQAQRPRWMQKRGNNSMGADEGVVVYFDNAKLGGVATLRQIATSSVVSVRYYDAAAANFRFGPGHRHGAIVVSTKS